MKFQVTQDHIDKATRGSATNCPVARAVSEGLKGYSMIDSVAATCERIILYWQGKFLSFRHITGVKEFVLAFDHNEPVEPTEIEVNTDFDEFLASLNTPVQP
jgi:hypothetical protein